MQQSDQGLNILDFLVRNESKNIFEIRKSKLMAKIEF